MSTYTKHIAECDYCGKTATMEPINMHVPDAGYALPGGWFRDAINRDVIMCPDCTREQYLSDPDRVMKAIHSDSVTSEWFLDSTWRCDNCKHEFEHTLTICPWCGAEMTNGTTNYR